MSTRAAQSTSPLYRPVLVIIDEGLQKSGNELSMPGWADLFAGGRATFRSSHQTSFLQLADFAAFVVARAQWIASAGISKHRDREFLCRLQLPSKLAVVLAGGGARWTGENCALHGKPHYRPFAGLEQDPSHLGGIFDTENPENPIADYTIVYLPTANGDVFLGDSVTTYDVPAMGGKPAGKINILHKGYDNAAAALDWMFKTYRDPKTVAVMGWSAGAIASPLFTHIVAQHYPNISVTHFADGGVTPPTTFDRPTTHRLADVGNRPLGGRQNHAVFANECDCFVSGHPASPHWRYASERIPRLA